MLSFVILNTQSVFVLRRFITDNVIVAFEVLYSLKLRRKCNRGSMAIKLDMIKVYDKVEWYFLRE